MAKVVPEELKVSIGDAELVPDGTAAHVPVNIEVPAGTSP